MGLAVSLLAMPAATADFRTLRRLEAPPPITVAAMPTDRPSNPVQLSKVVVQPREGEGWALIYRSILLSDPDNPPPADRILPWENGRFDAETSSFSRIFDEELKSAGFRSSGAGSLFEQASTPDLQVGVLIDDIKGRFCTDCPNLFQRDKIAAVVTMNARWEVYSALRGEVVAREITSTGATWRKAPQGSATQVIFDAFRENVRALLASDSFRSAVTTSQSQTQVASISPMRFVPAQAGKRTVASSANAVAAIFTGDGMGSGFLISPEGYLLTNHHVVGGAKYVKVRWSDGVETVGEVIRSDRRRDIAVVKADAGQRQALAVRTSTAALGEPVFAIGTPLQARFQGTVTKGIVSANRIYNGTPYIQSDVAVNGGNSGGPLLDENGAVVGVTVSGINISGAPVGINLFIPIDDALQTLALTPAT
jgi:S1-C subfamily serine protease